jgi:hypothetical protein
MIFLNLIRLKWFQNPFIPSLLPLIIISNQQPQILIWFYHLFTLLYYRVLWYRYIQIPLLLINLLHLFIIYLQLLNNSSYLSIYLIPFIFIILVFKFITILFDLLQILLEPLLLIWQFILPVIPLILQIIFKGINQLIYPLNWRIRIKDQFSLVFLHITPPSIIQQHKPLYQLSIVLYQIPPLYHLYLI